MKTRLIRIGSSKGILLPKAMIEQAKLQDDVEIAVKGDSLVIRPAAKPRDGWTEAFQEMALRGEDALVDGEIVNEFEQSEWRW